MLYLEPAAPFLVLIGPSAVGKTSLADCLARDGIINITPSWTTRPARSGEQSDFEHVFCDDATFQMQFAGGAFIDTAQPFSDGTWYGLPRIRKPESGLTAMVLLRAMVLDKLFAHYTGAIIYQIESARQDVSSRLSLRAEQGADNANRLALYEQELALGRTLARRCFVNTNLSELTQAVKQAISKDFN